MWNVPEGQEALGHGGIQVGRICDDAVAGGLESAGARTSTAAAVASRGKLRPSASRLLVVRQLDGVESFIDLKKIVGCSSLYARAQIEIAGERVWWWWWWWWWWSAEILVVTGEAGLIYDFQRANFLLEAAWDQLAGLTDGHCAAKPSTGGLVRMVAKQATLLGRQFLGAERLFFLSLGGGASIGQAPRPNRQAVEAVVAGVWDGEEAVWEGKETGEGEEEEGGGERMAGI